MRFNPTYFFKVCLFVVKFANLFMFWTYSPSFLMLHMKIFPRPMDGRGGRHEPLLNAQTCSTKSKGKPPGTTVSCCRAQAAGIFSCSSPSAFLSTFLSKQGLISRQHWHHQVKLCTSEHSGETALPRRIVLGLVLHSKWGTKTFTLQDSARCGTKCY